MSRSGDVRETCFSGYFNAQRDVNIYKFQMGNYDVKTASSFNRKTALTKAVKWPFKVNERLTEMKNSDVFFIAV